MTIRKKAQKASREIGAEPVRVEWCAETVLFVKAAKAAFDRGDSECLAEAWQVAAHAICFEVDERYEAPQLEIRHRTATKVTVAKYNWSLSDGMARIQLDFAKQILHGWERHASDFAHELAHHIDIWAFGLADSYHTRAFYMRSTVLSLKILTATAT